MGDYTGRTGLERTYEKVLMGRRGVKNYIRDNKSRLQGEYEKGMYDTAAVAGKNMFSSLDVELQKMAEELMTNKVGSVVAIDPQTGGILCMVSAPTFDPNYLYSHPFGIPPLCAHAGRWYLLRRYTPANDRQHDRDSYVQSAHSGRSH